MAGPMREPGRMRGTRWTVELALRRSYRKDVAHPRHRLHRLLSAFFPAVLAACGATEPYLYNAVEFDRTVEGFGREPEDISGVEVCYLSTRTAFSEVVEMAEQRCGQFDRTAVFLETSYITCPLSTPTLARFACLGAGETLEDLEAPARRGGTEAAPISPEALPADPAELGAE